MISIPLSICAIRLGGSLLTRFVRASRSSVTNSDALAAESFGNPEVRAVSNVLPGASAQRKLLVRGAHTTVAIRLRLSASPCTTTTGRRKPGPDPFGSGSAAHQISPCATSTTRCAAASARLPPQRSGLRRTRPDPLPDSSPRSPRRAHADRATRRALRRKAGCATSSNVARAAQPRGTCDQVWRLPFSYQWYDCRTSGRQSLLRSAPSLLQSHEVRAKGPRRLNFNRGGPLCSYFRGTPRDAAQGAGSSPAAALLLACCAFPFPAPLAAVVPTGTAATAPSSIPPRVTSCAASTVWITLAMLFVATSPAPMPPRRLPRSFRRMWA